MAIDQAEFGNIAARLMEQLDDYGEDASIEAAALVVAVDHEQGTQTTVHFNFSQGMSPYQGIGLLQFAAKQLGG